jgi:hypothetical protein
VHAVTTTQVDKAAGARTTFEHDLPGHSFTPENCNRLSNGLGRLPRNIGRAADSLGNAMAILDTNSIHVSPAFRRTAKPALSIMHTLAYADLADVRSRDHYRAELKKLKKAQIMLDKLARKELRLGTTMVDVYRLRGALSGAILTVRTKLRYMRRQARFIPQIPIRNEKSNNARDDF